MENLQTGNTFADGYTLNYRLLEGRSEIMRSRRPLLLTFKSTTNTKERRDVLKCNLPHRREDAQIELYLRLSRSWIIRSDSSRVQLEIHQSFRSGSPR